MAYRHLRAFVDALAEKGLLKIIDVEVDRHLEIAEIADRSVKQGGPALLFTNVKDSRYPLLINAFGSYHHLNVAFEIDRIDEIGDRITSLMDLSRYQTLRGSVRAVPSLAKLATSIFPRRVRKAPCQEIVEREPDLGTLPILTCWPEDGGPFITLPLVITKDPETGSQNVGMYRLHVYDRNTTGMHWHIHKDGRRIYEKYQTRGGRMPVSVAIGGDPSLIYAATAPMPKAINEMLFAGFIRGKRLPIVKSITNDIYVPAQADFILEGYVDVDETRLEGPFGDHTGYYSLADQYPVFHVTCLTHRRDAIYPATIVGRPPMEDCYLAKATERIFLPFLKMLFPEVIDISFPLEGVFHNCVIVQAKHEYPGQARKIMHGFWGLAQMMYTKMVIVVGPEIDPHDHRAVALTLCCRIDPRRDLVLVEGPLDALDHASPAPHYGHKLGIDLTAEPAITTPPLSQKVDLSALQKRDDALRGIAFPFDRHPQALAVIAIRKTEPNQVRRLLRNLWQTEPIGGVKVMIVVDDSVDYRDFSTVAWKLFNNIDAGRDLVVFDDEKGGCHLGVDATKKGALDGHPRDWPHDIVMDEATKAKVTERWQAYGLD